MAKNLLIVESPAKAKTINKYLGKDFLVLASYGHVRDLRPKEGAVDPDDDFKRAYEVIDKNEKHVDAIAKAAEHAESLYLATDLDLEGEAISWHIAEILRARAVAGSRQRATGAACARLPRRLQPVAGAVAQGAAGTVRRPCAVARAAHDRGARRRNRSVQAARILDHRSRLRASGPALLGASAASARQEVRAVRSHQHQRRTRRARRDREIRAGPPRRQRGAVEGTQAPSIAAVHHIHPAAGSCAQARFLDQPHDAHRAGSVR